MNPTYKVIFKLFVSILFLNYDQRLVNMNRRTVEIHYVGGRALKPFPLDDISFLFYFCYFYLTNSHKLKSWVCSRPAYFQIQCIKTNYPPYWDIGLLTTDNQANKSSNTGLFGFQEQRNICTVHKLIKKTKGLWYSIPPNTAILLNSNAKSEGFNKIKCIVFNATNDIYLQVFIQD